MPDLPGLRLVHRALLRDADRLTVLAERLASGGTSVRPARARAVAQDVHGWSGSVCAHHSAEDELLWPLLVVSAGGHVDPSELRDDHVALGAALDRLQEVAAAFGGRPDEVTAPALALELAELRDALHEHIGEEERVVLPLVERYVRAGDWRRVQAAIAWRTQLRPSPAAPS